MGALQASWHSILRSRCSSAEGFTGAKPNSVAKLQGAHHIPHFNSQGCVWTRTDPVCAGVAAGTAEAATTEAGWRTGPGDSQGTSGPTSFDRIARSKALHLRHMGPLYLRTPGACWSGDRDGRSSCCGRLAYRRGCFPWHVGGRRAHGCLPAIASQNITPCANLLLHRAASDSGTAFPCSGI